LKIKIRTIQHDGHNIFQYKKEIFFTGLDVSAEFMHGDLAVRRGLRKVASGFVGDCKGDCCFYIHLPNEKEEVWGGGVHSVILADELEVGDRIILKTKGDIDFINLIAEHRIV